MTTNDELLRAAERYRKLMHTPAIYPDVYGLPKTLSPDRTRQAYDEAFRRDCLIICDAYLATLAAREGDEINRLYNDISKCFDYRMEPSECDEILARLAKALGISAGEQDT
jgi:hypothetical protein